MNLVNLIVSVMLSLFIMASTVSAYPQFPFTIRPRKKHKPFGLHGKFQWKVSDGEIFIIYLPFASIRTQN